MTVTMTSVKNYLPFFDSSKNLIIRPLTLGVLWKYFGKELPSKFRKYSRKRFGFESIFPKKSFFSGKKGCSVGIL